MPQYSRAPIVEAIIDLRVISSNTISSLDLADAIGKIEDYPHRQSLAVNPAFQFSDGDFSAAIGSLSEGLRYISHDHKKVFQARLDGFTISVLPPYEDWTLLQSEAQRLWEIYLSARQPNKLVRVAVRYINHCPIPKGTLASQLLNTVPHLPTQIGILEEFEQRCQMAHPDLEATLLLTQATLTQPQSQDRSILLDIDLFRTKSLWDISDKTALWDYMERLRTRKNLIFESCITDDMRSLIQ